MKHCLVALLALMLFAVVGCSGRNYATTEGSTGARARPHPTTILVLKVPGPPGGTIVVDDLKGAPGVSVLVNELERTFITDEKGFITTDLPAGVYTFILTGPGLKRSIYRHESVTADGANLTFLIADYKELDLDRHADTGPATWAGHLVVRVRSGEKGDNHPLSGAKVVIRETGQSALTDERGLAGFGLPVYFREAGSADRKPAYYTLSVTLPGFTTETYLDVHGFEGALNTEQLIDATVMDIFLVPGVGENRHQSPCLDATPPPCHPSEGAK
ncbi:MAG: carboxypeptidase-like regulatory domain-containing protein [Mycobacterium leprae]